jgi:hypothetical protein
VEQGVGRGGWGDRGALFHRMVSPLPSFYWSPGLTGLVAVVRSFIHNFLRLRIRYIAIS